MVTCFGLIHIAIPLADAFGFLFFQFELDKHTHILLLQLIIFVLLFVLYSIATYMVLNVGPGYQPHKTKVSMETIIEYQSMEERRKTIIQDIQRAQLASQYLRSLEQELASLFAKTSYCQMCQVIKSPRTHHCRICKRCVLRMQHHSFLIGGCIGQGNHRQYLQYLFYTLLLTGYTSLVCFLNTFNHKSLVENWSSQKQIAYTLLSAVNLAVCVVSFIYFQRGIRLARNNITGVEAKIRCFKKHNPFVQEPYLSTIFTGPGDLLCMHYPSVVDELQLVEVTTE